MEEMIYFAVRLGCAAYLLYKVWEQKGRLRTLCDLFYTPVRKKEKETAPPAPANEANVMGATRFVYLDENAGKTATPYMSQQLEMGSDFIGEDEEVLEEEVECNLPLEEMNMLREEQEELDSQYRDTETVVPAVTSADLLNVGDVLFNLNGAGADEEKSHRAAVTLHIIRETDLFEMISAQVENKRLIDELMDRYVDEERNALPVKKERNRGKPVVDWRKLV